MKKHTLAGGTYRRWMILAALVVWVGMAAGCGPEPPDDTGEIPNPGNDIPPLSPSCGNGVVEGSEVCDGDEVANCPPNHICSDACFCVTDSANPTCGNNVLEVGEQCEAEACYPATLSTSGEVCLWNLGCSGGEVCNSQCSCVEKDVCGNGILESGEECDGNPCSDNSPCSTDCTCSDCPADADSPPCVGPQTVGLSCTLSSGAYGICSGSSAGTGWWKTGCDCEPPCPQDSECAGKWDGYPCEKDGVPGDCLDCKCVDSCTTLEFYCEENPDDCPTQGTCLVDADCASGEYCTEGCSCMPATCPANSDGCQTDADCPSGLTCDIANCICFSVCGDGVVGSGEECDGSDLSQCLAGQVCENCQCITYATTCGNGTVEPNEQCDAPDLTQCTSSQSCINCQCVTQVQADVCGNNVIDAGEECDGTLCDNPAEVCTATCQCEPVPVEPPPPPEDQPLEGADGSLCGDGICQAGESGVWCGDCPSEGGDDDGDGDDDGKDKDEDKDKDKDGDGDGGRTAPVCGNGKVESGEACDDGGNNGKCGFCDSSCSRVLIC